MDNRIASVMTVLILVSLARASEPSVAGESPAPAAEQAPGRFTVTTPLDGEVLMVTQWAVQWYLHTDPMVHGSFEPYPALYGEVALPSVSQRVVYIWAELLLEDRVPFAGPDIYRIGRMRTTAEGTAVDFERLPYEFTATRAMIAVLPRVADAELAEEIVLTVIRHRLAGQSADRIEGGPDEALWVMLDLVRALGTVGSHRSLPVLRQIAAEGTSLLLGSSATEAIEAVEARQRTWAQPQPAKATADESNAPGRPRRGALSTR